MAPCTLNLYSRRTEVGTVVHCIAPYFCTRVHGVPHDLVSNGRAISNTELSILFQISRTSLRKVIHNLF